MNLRDAIGLDPTTNDIFFLNEKMKMTNLSNEKKNWDHSRIMESCLFLEIFFLSHE